MEIMKPFTSLIAACAVLLSVSGAAGKSTKNVAPSAADSQLRVHLHPSKVRLLDDSDFNVWTITLGDGVTNASTTIDGLDFTLSSPDDQTLDGNSFKLVYARFLSQLGERQAGEGVTTQLSEDGTPGHPLALTITGLAAGDHSLLSWHNAWDRLSDAASLSITVNGDEAVSDLEQSVRVDNIWEAATSYLEFSVSGPDDVTEIIYTPSGADGRAFLNGFEIDTPKMSNQISFPDPPNRLERVELDDGSVTASWHAATTSGTPKYNVYLGTSPSKLDPVATDLVDTEVKFTGLGVMDIYYWRVDVVAGDEVYIGRVFMFRGAQLAFPGAEGYGRFARGGRGGEVIKVTTLDDNEDPGSLRYALSIATGPRIVVFDIGGVITLKSRMTVNDQYVTVAGQTAPGKGIAITGMPVGLTGASDVIFRHMRVRPGTISGETIDGMGMQGSNYCIFDRCSMGWAIDESFSSRSAYNITFQRNMISEPLNVAGHKNYPEGKAHGFAATISGDIGSFHHNLIAHAEGRSWSMGGGVDNNATFAGRLDIRNNVVYNFGARVTDGGVHECNFVGNLYKPGAASSLTYALKAQYENQLPGTQQYHCDGNSMPGHFDQDSTQYPPGDGTSINENIACWADVTIDPPPSYQPFFAKPFWGGVSHIEEQSSTEAYKRVLSDSGASQPVVDDHDKRIVNETYHGTYTYVGSVSGKPGLIDSDKDAGGLEDFPTTTRPDSWDADGDGIADWWDGSTGGDGYTVIEGYLNFMADPHAFVAPGASVEIDLAALARGFDEPTFTVSGGSLGNVKASESKATYSAGHEAGIDHFDIDVEDSEGSMWSRTFGIAIFEDAR